MLINIVMSLYVRSLIFEHIVRYFEKCGGSFYIVARGPINRLIHFWKNFCFKDQYIGGVAKIEPDSITGD